MAAGFIFDIRHYSIHDGPGIRSTVFLKGCPLACWWCHNPESINPQPELIYREDRCIGCGACIPACPQKAIARTSDGHVATAAACDACGACAAACPTLARERAGRWTESSEVLKLIRREKSFFDSSGGGVTFSGGEPFTQPAFLLTMLKACRDEGIHTAVDTSGFAARSALLEAARYADLFLYDLKLMDAAQHRTYTGVDNTLILDNLVALSRAGAAISIRIPLIPGVNDSEENLLAIGRFIAELSGIQSVHLLPYHASGRSKYARLGRHYRLPDTPTPSLQQQERAAALLRRFHAAVTLGG